MVRKTLKSTVTVDSALAKLLNSVGQRKDRDMHAVWAACQVLRRLGLVNDSQNTTKKKDGTVTVEFFFESNGELQELMEENHV